MFISVSLFEVLVIEYIQHICFNTTKKLPFCGYNMYVANIQDENAMGSDPFLFIFVPTWFISKKDK